MVYMRLPIPEKTWNKTGHEWTIFRFVILSRITSSTIELPSRIYDLTLPPRKWNTSWVYECGFGTGLNNVKLMRKNADCWIYDNSWFCFTLVLPVMIYHLMWLLVIYNKAAVLCRYNTVHFLPSTFSLNNRHAIARHEGEIRRSFHEFKSSCLIHCSAVLWYIGLRHDGTECVLAVQHLVISWINI